MSSFFKRFFGVLFKQHAESADHASIGRLTEKTIPGRLARQFIQELAPPTDLDIKIDYDSAFGNAKDAALTALTSVEVEPQHKHRPAGESRQAESALNIDDVIDGVVVDHCDTDPLPISTEDGHVLVEVAVAVAPVEHEDFVPVTLEPHSHGDASSLGVPCSDILQGFEGNVRQPNGKRESASVGAARHIPKTVRLDPGAVAAEQLPTVAETMAIIPVLEEPQPATEHADGKETADQVHGGPHEDDASLSDDGKTVGEMMLEGDCSVRLSNCIATNQDVFGKWTIGRALAHRLEFTSALKQIRNLGRKTADEALDALDAYALEHGVDDAPEVTDRLLGLDAAKLNETIRDVLKQSHVSVRLANVVASGALDGLKVSHFVLDPATVRARVMGCKNTGRKTSDEAMEVLASHVEKLGNPEVDQGSVKADYVPTEGITAGQWVRQEVGSLLPKQIEVLQSRYGLDGRKKESLEEIAKRVFVTRERVRQVEAKALKRLRDAGRSRAAFGRYIEEERDTQWAILFGPTGSLADEEISERFRQTDPWFNLGIDVIFENRRAEYLRANAHRMLTGWFRNADEAADHQNRDRILKGFLAAHPTPMPLDTCEEIDPSAASLLQGAGGDWAVHDGYVFVGHVGAKARRTARMHVIARRISKSGLFDMGTLIAAYRAEYPSDNYGSRVFDIEAGEAPHLFARFFDGIWLCLELAPRHAARLIDPPFERGRVEDRHFSDGSYGDLIMKRLEKFGPQRLVDLKDTVGNGISALLKQNPCFRRIAPGVFDTYTGSEQFPESLDDLVVEERHCRTYCHARHCGAPSGYYPAWGPSYEMRLAQWAKRHAPAELFRSLMWVIEPASWPGSPETVAKFQALQKQSGRWEIDVARRHPLGQRFPDAGQFLAILKHLVAFGWIGWVGVNRITGSIATDRRAADVLAFLTMTGIVEPEPDWQVPHRPTDLAGGLLREAIWERHLHGDGAGVEGVLGRLQSALVANPPPASRGWVDVDEFKAAMPAWQSEGMSTGRAFGGGLPRQVRIDADDVFDSEDWGAIFD